jgi:hypothetical protein
MDRRLLLVPASALFAQAQSSPEAVEAEKALRQRVEEFYKLQQDKKFRQAEDYVAEESKDDYYNGRKQEVIDYHIEKIILTDDNTKAKVMVKTKVVVLFAGAQEFDMQAETTWKIDNGKWCWYLDPETKNLTPFGRMATFDKAGVPDIKGLDKTGEAPDLNEILKKISIDRTVLAFTGNALSQSVTITNGTPGPLRLALDPHVAQIAGLSAEIDKLTLDGGEKATVTLKWDGSTPIEHDVVYVRVDPYQRGFNIRVSAK